jgi:hypothetical protein
MINFFRKIRKKMADENKPMKYMRYAIGEILLVVVGILIALSINNWNEQNKLNIKERLILKEMENNLQSNINMLQNKIKSQNVIRANITALTNFIDGKQTLNSDSIYLFLERIRRLDQMEYNDAAYQSLKIIGFDVIRSDSLRFSIIDLFDNQYELHKNLNNTADLARYNSLNNYYENHFKVVDGLVVPNNMREIFKNQIFYNKLTLREDWKAFSVNISNRILEKSESLKSHIQKELLEGTD